MSSFCYSWHGTSSHVMSCRMYFSCGMVWWGTVLCGVNEMSVVWCGVMWCGLNSVFSSFFVSHFLLIFFCLAKLSSFLYFSFSILFSSFILPYPPLILSFPLLLSSFPLLFFSHPSLFSSSLILPSSPLPLSFFLHFFISSFLIW